MSGHEQAFEQAWAELSSGRENIEDILSRHPEVRQELRGMLEAAAWLSEGPAIGAPDNVKAIGRRRLLAHMAANPRAEPDRPSLFASLFRRRLAPALAALALFVSAGTAAAQTAGPGDLLYGWRQVSESAWLAVSPDKPSTALVVADRRARELLMAPAGSQQFELAAEAYQAWIARIVEQGLLTETIGRALAGHRQQFQEQGIPVPALEGQLEGELQEPILPTLELTAPALPTLAPELLDPPDLFD